MALHVNDYNETNDEDNHDDFNTVGDCCFFPPFPAKELEFIIFGG